MLLDIQGDMNVIKNTMNELKKLSDEEKENIKYRLSDLGVQVGQLAINYINELEKENAELKEQNKTILEDNDTKLKKCAHCESCVKLFDNCKMELEK